MAYIGREPLGGEVIIMDSIESQFNGVLTTFNLTRTVSGVTTAFYPVGSQQLLVSLGGVIQRPDPTGNTGFRISFNTIIFAVAPPASTSCFIISYGNLIDIGAPANNTVTTDKLVDGSVTPIKLSTGGPWWLSSGNVGIGTTNPSSLLTIKDGTDTVFSTAQLKIGDSVNDVGIQFSQASDNIGASRLIFAKSRGTLSSPTTVVNNDQLFTLRGSGYVGSTGGWVSGGLIGFYVDGSVSNTTNGLGAKFSVYTSPAGGGNAERLTITSTGNVGIGTTPGEKLDVSSGTSGTAAVVKIQDPAGRVLQIASPGASTEAYIGTTTNHRLDFYTNNGVKATLDQSGRLLVGTSSTSGNVAGSDKLAVVITGDNTQGGISVTDYAGNSSTIGSYAALRLQRSIGTTDGSFTALTASSWGLGRIEFNGSNGVGFGTGATIEGVADTLAWGNGDHPARLVFSTTADGAASPTERLRITSAGLVGIGTSAPWERLSIPFDDKLSFGSSTFPFSISRTIAGELLTTFSDGYNNVLARIDFKMRAGSASENTPLSIVGSGRVGIGTTSPDAKLLVSDGANINTRIGQLSLNNFAGAGAGIQFSRTTSDDSLCALGVVNSIAGDLGLFSRNSLIFATGGASTYSATTEVARIDTSGRLLVGTSSARLYTSLGYAKFQLEGTSFADSSIGLTNNQTTNDGAYLVFNKTRGTAIGSVTSVLRGDLLGSIWFQGTDGTSPIRGATIEAAVDGTPGANDMPGRLVFSTTADGAASPTERLRITSAGLVGIGTTSPGFQLDTRVSGAGAIANFSDGTQNLTIGTASGSVGFVNGASGVLGLYSSGSERARIDSSGRVGIGTTAPVNSLQVTTSALASVPSAGSSGHFLAVGSAAYGIAGGALTNGNGYLQVTRWDGTATNYNLLLQPNGGNVGIGTTSPNLIGVNANSRCLSIVGDGTTTNARGTLELRNPIADAAGITLGSIYFNGGAAAINYAEIRAVSSGTGGVNGFGNELRFATKDDNGTTSNKMFLTSTGNLGIGTTNPLTKLQVEGTGLFVAASSSFGTGNAAIWPNTPNQTISAFFGSGLSVSSLTGDQYSTAIRFNGSNVAWGDMSYYPNQGGQGHFRFSLAGSSVITTPNAIVGVGGLYSFGNVGIGTTNPLTKLSVNGETSVGQGKRLSLIGLDINGSSPSYLKIRTSIPFVSASADFTVNIKGFRYGGANTTDLSICWHYYNSTFYNATASSSGSWAPVIVLSAESGLVCITLYSPGYWPKLYVESMYSSVYSDSYCTGWSWVDEAPGGTNNVTVSYKSDFGNLFVMTGDGNVGIGTTNPAYKLDVRGSSWINGASIQGATVMFGASPITKTITISTANSDCFMIVASAYTSGGSHSAVKQFIVGGYIPGSTQYAAATVSSATTGSAMAISDITKANASFSFTMTLSTSLNSQGEVAITSRFPATITIT